MSSGLLWLASVRWNAFFISQFGDTRGVAAGTGVYLWTTTELRERNSRNFGLLLEPQWTWHVSPRQRPLEWLPGYSSSASGRRVVAVPLWMPFAAVSGLAVAPWMYGRRPPPGHCQHCRYDVRSLPPGAECPECGAAPRP